MFNMIENVLQHLILLVFTLITSARCGTVTATKTEYKPVNGSTVVLSWNYVVGADESLLAVSIYNGTDTDNANKLWQSGGNVYAPKILQLFGDRFVVYQETLGKIQVTIKDIKYNESLTFNLKVVFDNGNTYKSATASIKVNVQGGPDLCGNILGEYSFGYQSQPSIHLCVSGNPQPEMEFTFNKETETVTEALLIDSPTHQFNYTMKLPQLKAEHCGEELNFTVTSKLDGSKTLIGKTKILLLEKDFPLEVPVTSFTFVNSIPTANWDPVVSGKCEIKYFLNITNATSMRKFGPITGTSLQVLNMGEPTGGSIVAAYGSTRSKTIENFVFTKTTTSTTPTTTTPTTVATNKSTSNEGGGDNLGMIIGCAVGGVAVLVIIIFLIWKFKCKNKRSESNVELNITRNGNGGDTGTEMRWSSNRSKNEYVTVPNTVRPQEDPNQAIYSELGPGGRVGPKPTPATSNYAEVLVDEDGFPITGETRETNNPSLYDQVRKDSDEYDGGVIV